MIKVKMLVDKSVNGFDRKKGEVIKADSWTAISLVDRGDAEFTDDVPKEVAEKAKPEKKSAGYETAMAEPEEKEVVEPDKPRKYGRRKR